MITLLLIVKCHHLASNIPGSNYSHCINFLSSVTAVLTVRSDFQGKAIKELFKGAKVPHTNLFPTIFIKDSSGPSQSD